MTRAGARAGQSWGHVAARASAALNGLHFCPVRTVLEPLGFFVAGMTIGRVLGRRMNRLIWRDAEIDVDIAFPPGSEAERSWRERAAGLGGTSPLAL